MYQTRVQASTLSFPELISKLPQIGLQGLYRGSIPAILGQFSRSVLFNWFICKILCRLQNSNPVIFSHGLRTGIFEATKLVLINVAPTLPEIQVRFTAPVLVQTPYFKGPGAPYKSHDGTELSICNRNFLASAITVVLCGIA